MNKTSLDLFLCFIASQTNKEAKKEPRESRNRPDEIWFHELVYLSCGHSLRFSVSSQDEFMDVFYVYVKSFTGAINVTRHYSRNCFD